MMLLLISFINQAINPDVQLEFGPGRAGPGLGDTLTLLLLLLLLN